MRTEIKLFYKNELGDKIISSIDEEIKKSDYFVVLTYKKYKDGYIRNYKKEIMTSLEFIEFTKYLNKNKQKIKDSEITYISQIFDRYKIHTIKDFENCNKIKFNMKDVKIDKKNYIMNEKIFIHNGRYFSYRDLENLNYMLDDLIYKYKINDDDEDDYYAYHIKFTKENLQKLKNDIQNYKISEYIDLTPKYIKENLQMFKKSCKLVKKGCDFEIIEEYYNF